MQACRNTLRTLPLQHGSHAGLLLNRYLREPVTEPKAKTQLFLAAVSSLQNNTKIYEQAYQVWEQHVAKTCLPETVQTEGRMVLGLGSESSLETGLRLHYTYGTPLIPGSALKGLAAHYCHQVWGKQDKEFLGTLEIEEQGKKKTLPSGKYFETLFGTTDDSGAIIFHDAMILPQSLGNSLALDVMTVHHSDYYNNGKASPTDYDDPNPIAFLSIQGQFKLALQCVVDNEEGKRWESLAMKLLLEALSVWGIGGKTNAGYGRMTKVSPNQPNTSSQANAKTPRYKTGDKVTVTRVEDPKGKKDRIWLKADDGFCGVIIDKEKPTIKMEEKMECWIASVGNTYNFTTKPFQQHPAPKSTKR